MARDPLDQLNLHHLRALDTLLQERSVTRAAKRLGLTPSALSHALRGLREVLDDPLLVRGSGGMVPTPRAESLALPLRRALHDLSQALTDAPAFDPATAQRTFRVSMPDPFAFLVAPRLVARVREEAPGVDIEVFGLPGAAMAEALESGDADLAITVGMPAGPGLRVRTLARGGFACVARRDHPELREGLDLDTYCRVPHALLSPQGRGLGAVDVALSELGRERRVQLRIRYFLAAPAIIARSDLLLTGPGELLRAFAELVDLEAHEPPVHLEPFVTRSVWHERMDGDPGLRWLRDLLHEVADDRLGGGRVGG